MKRDLFQKVLDAVVTLWAVVMFVVCAVLMFTTSSCTSTASQMADSLVLYDQYYRTTEKLLTEIDKTYDWSTEWADSGKEESIDYYWIRYNVNDSKGLSISQTLNHLRQYHNETQKLLLMLEEEYGWLDTVGEADVYCEWYEINKQLNKEN